MKVLKFLIVLVAVSFGCNKTPSPSKKPLVLVSIAPHQCFVERIGGDAIAVTPIAPLDVDPHIFEPTARQMAEISRAVVWFRVGEPFEEKIAATFRNRMHISDLRSSDRHGWVSPKSALQQAEMIERALSEQFPEQEEMFKNNFSALQRDLEALDREIHSMLASSSQRVLLVSHPAFGAFCRDYGLEQLSLEEEGKEARPRHVEETLQKVRKMGARFALALPQYNNKGIERIAEQLELPIFSLNPYSKDYFSTMRTLANYLADSP